MIKENAILSGILIVVGIVLAITLSAIITSKIRKSLEVMSAGMARMASGDFTEKVVITSSDEFGQQADNFNQLLIKFKELFDHLKDASARVASGSTELSATATEVAQTASEVAQLSEHQRMSAEQSATAIHQFSASIKEVANNVKSSNVRMENMVELVEDGVKKGNFTVKAMEAITENSERISNVLAVITDIANQTNLLSLNAAIEAAHAGDKGKGFAVVAEEVRKLAERSAVAASDVLVLISKTHDVMAKGLESVNSTEASLVTLKDDIRDIADMSRQIGAASEQQRATSTEIARRTEESTAATERSAAAANQLTATVEEVNKTAEYLAQISDELAEYITQFRTT